MRKYLFALIALALPGCAKAQQFPGTYTIVGYAKPGTHEAGKVPRDLQELMLILREDGSVTMRGTGSPGEGEYSVNTAEHTAIIRDGPQALLARFSNDTLVTRSPGGGPAFYWKRVTRQ